MQIGYSCMGSGNASRRLSGWSKTALLGIGLFALPGTLKLESLPHLRPSPVASPAVDRRLQAASVKPDPRVARLQRFLAGLRCPVAGMAEDFVHAADDNHLDWRLLPSIAVIESGGGKAYKNNNLFGWANGDHLFPTLRSGIHEVAFALGKSSLYRDRDVEAKLHLYNPDEAYAGNVIAVMNRISPAAKL